MNNYRLLAFTAAFKALSNPLRADMVAALGETTGERALFKIRNTMLKDTSGRRILRERPIVHTSSINLQALEAFGQDSFGFAYVKFLRDNGVTPDSRINVKYIKDPELAYVMLRYRQVHDFWHTLAQLPIAVEAEIGLKCFEYLQTGLPMNALAFLFGPLSLSTGERDEFFNMYLPWALNCHSTSQYLMNVKYEDHFATSLAEVQKKFGIFPLSHRRS